MRQAASLGGAVEEERGFGEEESPTNGGGSMRRMTALGVAPPPPTATESTQPAPGERTTGTYYVPSPLYPPPIAREKKSTMPPRSQGRMKTPSSSGYSCVYTPEDRPVEQVVLSPSRRPRA